MYRYIQHLSTPDKCCISLVNLGLTDVLMSGVALRAQGCRVAPGSLILYHHIILSHIRKKKRSVKLELIRIHLVGVLPSCQFYFRWIL